MKLGTKFSLLNSLLVAGIVLGVTGSLLVTESRFLIREMEQSRVNMVNGLAQVTRESLIGKDEIILLNYLKLLKSSPGLVYAAVTDTAGAVLGHTDMELLGKRLADPASRRALAASSLLVQRFSGTDALPVLDLALPVAVADRKAAIVRIGFSQTLLERAVEEALAITRRRILMVGCAALAVGLIGAFLITRFMIAPIRTIAAGAEMIGKGKLDHMIDVKSRDELGDLAIEFNRMSGRLKELDQMKSDFVSSVTHELRSPLLSLKMYIDLFLKGTAGTVGEKQAEYLHIMKNCTARLATFIDDLLDMAKIERGKMEVTLQPIDLATVFTEVAQLFAPQVDQKKIRLSFDIPASFPRLMADPDRTRQVLINLLSNAVKFTPQDGTIAVQAKQNGAKAEVSVADSGIGIPGDKLDRIFDKFEQVKDVRSKIAGPKGTGLGLAIVKGIVELQQGTIRVESAPGKGSTFIFTLPLAS